MRSWKIFFSARERKSSEEENSLVAERVKVDSVAVIVAVSDPVVKVVTERKQSVQKYATDFHHKTNSLYTVETEVAVVVSLSVDVAVVVLVEADCVVVANDGRGAPISSTTEEFRSLTCL